MNTKQDRPNPGATGQGAPALQGTRPEESRQAPPVEQTEEGPVIDSTAWTGDDPGSGGGPSSDLPAPGEGK